MDEIVYGKSGCSWLAKLSEKERSEALFNIRKNTFDNITHYFYKEGISLETMVKVLAEKAHRHSYAREQALAFLIDDAIKKLELWQENENKEMSTIMSKMNFSAASNS